MENKTYAILQREININTGDIYVSVSKVGTKDMLIDDISYCKLRSQFNPELTYFLTFEEYADIVKKMLENKEVKSNNLYGKI